MSEVFIGRQPIIDRDHRTFGYELLYRDAADAQVLFDDPDDATRCVMQRAMLDWGMERIIGNRFGFINASAHLIVNGMHRVLPPEGIIIEITEHGGESDTEIEALFRAKRDGYHFALDNVRTEDELRRSRLAQIVSLVKVEMMDNTPTEVERIAAWVRSELPGTLLVAEKVETHGQFTTAFDLNYDLFEGHYFARPEILSKAARPSNVTSTLMLLSELQRADVGVDRVEELVGSDPSLAYRLLTVVNSSAFGLDRRVESLRHAIVLLGIGQVRNLAALIALSSSKNVNEELIAAGVIRARTASSIATNDEARNAAFTVGLLSVTDSLYHTPMDELLKELPVSPEISAALLDRTGPYAQMLEIALACESADLARLNELAPGQIERVQQAYADAIRWADEFRGQVLTKQSKVVLPRSPGESLAAAH